VKRTYRFAVSTGSVSTRLPDGRTLTLPVVPGILKHPKPEALSALLMNSDAARKYTVAALRHAAWPVLCLFPVAWLRECLADAQVTEGRRQALLFLLGR
jgi:hypothetical protein